MGRRVGGLGRGRGRLGRRRRDVAGGGQRRRCAGRFGLRLLVAGQDIFGPFPWHQEVEAAEVLRKRDLLIDDALFSFRIAKLDVAGEREVLALRMALETVIGENPAQVAVPGEDGLKVIRIIETAFKSSEEKKVIDIR